MNQQCTRMQAPTIGYLTKQIPSSHGVAQYAQIFRSVLNEFGICVSVGTLHDNADSGSLLHSLRTAQGLRRRSDALDTLVVDLSGRAFAELFAASWFVRTRRSNQQLWLCVHDAPSVTGATFFIRLLDRRGLRRVAAWMTRRWGARWEGWLLAHADLIWTLSSDGAMALTARFSLCPPAVAIPHVAQPLTAVPERRGQVLFYPGHTGAQAVAPLLDVLIRHPRAYLIVGSCAKGEEARIRLHASELDVSGRVECTGTVPGLAELSAVYRRADIVVRLRTGPPQELAGQAVGGPLISAMAHGCAIVTNDPRGLQGFFKETRAAVVVDTIDQAVTAIEALLTKPEQLRAAQERAWVAVKKSHTPSAVAERLRQLARGSVTS